MSASMYQLHVGTEWLLDEPYTHCSSLFQGALATMGAFAAAGGALGVSCTFDATSFGFLYT